MPYKKSTFINTTLNTVISFIADKKWCDNKKIHLFVNYNKSFMSLNIDRSLFYKQNDGIIEQHDWETNVTMYDSFLLESLIPIIFFINGTSKDKILYVQLSNQNDTNPKLFPIPEKITFLENLDICITGKLQLYREEYVDIIEMFGGQFVSSVKYSELLVIGDKPGGTKLTDAKKYGIPMISEADFKKSLLIDKLVNSKKL